MIAFSVEQSASRARLRYEWFSARHQRRVGVAKERTVRTEGKRMGGDCSEESRLSQRARGWGIGARRKFETPHRSADGRCPGEMDRAAHAFVCGTHLADHFGDCPGMGSAQRPAPHPAGRRFARCDRARSQTQIGHAQRKKRRGPRSFAAKSVELGVGVFSPGSVLKSVLAGLLACYLFAAIVGVLI